MDSSPCLAPKRRTATTWAPTAWEQRSGGIISNVYKFGNCWFQFARRVAHIFAAVPLVGCAAERLTSIEEVLAHPNSFADSTITVKGTLSSTGFHVPFSDIVVRRLINGKDTLTFVALPDTFPSGRELRVRGQVHVQEVLGVVRFGPVLVAGDLSSALAGVTRRLP